MFIDYIDSSNTRKSHASANSDHDATNKQTESSVACDSTVDMQDASNSGSDVTNEMQDASAMEVTDPVTDGDQENVKDQILKESIDGLILDPTEAKTPSGSWCWLPAEVEAFDKETRESFTRSCVKFTQVEDQVIYSKSVTVIGNDLFYRSKGILVSPSFLPKSFVCVLDLEDAIARFDSSSFCTGCDPKFGEQLATMKSVTQGKCNWRSKRCLKVLERGSICHYCHQLNELLPLKQTRMEKLVIRNKKLVASNDAKEKQVKRKTDAIKVLLKKFSLMYTVM